MTTAMEDRAPRTGGRRSGRPEAAGHRTAVANASDPAKRCQRRGGASRGEACGALRFWDSSAIIPLLVGEATTEAMLATAEEDPVMLVWWGTQVECVSTIARLERQGDLTSEVTLAALGRLDALAEGWNEVQPVEAARRTARRMLRVHSLRAADALQLAAAVVAAEGHVASLEIVTLDDRLIEAARREGFVVWRDAHGAAS